MEVRENCSNRQHKSAKRKRKRSVFSSHLLQIILQHNGSRMQRGGGGGGVVGQAAGAASVPEQKDFCLETLRQGGSSMLALQLCVSQGFGFTRQTHTVEAFGKAGPRLGDLLLPNDAQAVSCYCWSAFCLQANVTVVPELVPYWRLILGEREKSGQYGSH